MKTPSTKLFRLIQKMTPSEKRYFKRFGLLQQKNNANKYTLLFDAINAQKEYDEAALIDQFSEYDFVNNFSEIKKYLFNQIQKVLRNFHAQSSVNIILYGYLSDISVLYDKEMYDECNKLIQKAKKIAQKHEKWNILLLLNGWKRNLIKISHQVQGIEEYMTKEIEQDKEYIARLENEQQYFNKYLEKTFHLRKYGPNIPLESPLPSPDGPPLTFRAKRYDFSKRGLSGNIHKSYLATKEVIQLFDSNPHFIKAMPKQYIIALANIQDVCTHYAYNKEFDTYMNKAVKMLDNYPFDSEFKIREQLLIHIFKCSVYTRRNDPKALKESREQLLHKLKYTHQQGLLEDDLACYACYDLLRSAIALKDYESALEAYNNFVALNLGDYRTDIQMEVKSLGLMVHFELGHWILLDSLIRSANRLYQRKHTKFPLIKKHIDTLKKCTQLRQEKTSGDIRPLLKELRKDAEEKLSAGGLKFFFIFIGWIDSHLNKKTIMDCIFENLSQKDT